MSLENKNLMKETNLEDSKNDLENILIKDQ